MDVLDGSTGPYFQYEKVPGIVSDSSEVLDAAGVPKELQYKGTYAVEWIVYGAAYNPNLVKAADLPRKWEGFLDPKWKGQIAVESRLNLFVYATPHWGGEQKVISFLQQLKNQQPRFNRGDIASNKLLAAGEFPILLGSYLENYPRYVPQGAPWAFVPTEEVYVSARGPGYFVTAKAPHPNAGKLFLYWFMGPDGQKVYDERCGGNPLPGTGTGPSKFLEQNRIAVKVTPSEYETNVADYQKKYQSAIGLPSA
jgi:ABC-type Fe3+ transport system substrate-binding protein